jgi:hypothetical protein
MTRMAGIYRLSLTRPLEHLGRPRQSIQKTHQSARIMKATTSKHLARYLTLLAAIALAPCALANVLVESFETSVFPGSNPPYTTIAQSSAAGVTDGTYSMQVAFNNSGTWSWMEGNYGVTTYSDWKSHYKLEFDLHRAAESFGWNLNLAVAINGPQGWNQVELVAWDWHNAGQSSHKRLRGITRPSRPAHPFREHGGR